MVSVSEGASGMSVLRGGEPSKGVAVAGRWLSLAEAKGSALGSSFVMAKSKSVVGEGNGSKGHNSRQPANVAAEGFLPNLGIQ